jgi:hypothetical protein
MLALFLISFLVIMLAGLGMAVGLLCGRRSVQRSCAGLVNAPGLAAGLDLQCEHCCHVCPREAV